jgi:hypothetical protein
MDKNYQDWAIKMAGLNPNFSSAIFKSPNDDYDYNAAYMSGIKPELNPNDHMVHLSDIGKLPNHPTFSNESNYAKFPSLASTLPGSNIPQPGQWVGMENSPDWRYHNPSRGLFYADESQAYQPPTKNMLDLGRMVRALNPNDLARKSSF